MTTPSAVPATAGAPSPLHTAGKPATSGTGGLPAAPCHLLGSAQRTRHDLAGSLDGSGCASNSERTGHDTITAQLSEHSALEGFHDVDHRRIAGQRTFGEAGALFVSPHRFRPCSASDLRNPSGTLHRRK